LGKMLVCRNSLILISRMWLEMLIFKKIFIAFLFVSSFLKWLC
jgi:hypothetical protein